MAARRPAAKVIRGDAGERLLVEAAQKDPAKFGALYEIHFERIYAFVVRRVNDRDRAEDLTSEIFHKALANLKNYEWRGLPFQAWLFRIGRLPVLSILQDRRDRAVGARAQGQCSRAGGIKPLGVVTFRQAEDADAGAEPLLGMRARTQDDLDQRRGIVAKAAASRRIRSCVQSR